jgi:hypothetical protein
MLTGVLDTLSMTALVTGITSSNFPFCKALSIFLMTSSGKILQPVWYDAVEGKDVDNGVQ